MYRPVFIIPALFLIVSAAASTHSAAANDAAADALLSKQRSFVGWEFGDGSVRTLRLTEIKTISSNGSPKTLTTARELRMGAAFRDTVTTEKGITSESGFTGNLFWESNENGFTHPIVGDPQKLIVSRQLIFLGATTALPGTSQGTRTIEGRQLSVVRVGLPQSFSIDVYIDPSTGESKRYVIDPGGDNEQGLDVLAYIDALPRKKIISKWHYAGSTATHELTKIEANVPIAADELHPPKQAATWTFASAQPFHIDFRPYPSPRIYVEAKVNGVNGRFVLDSGAASIVLNQQFADRITAEKMRRSSGYGIGGVVATNIERIATMQVGGNTLRNVIVTALPIEIDKGVQIDGLIGYDFLAGAIVDVNLDRSQMTIYDPSNHPQSMDSGLQAIVDLADQTPSLPMKLNGIAVNAMLDSGNPTSVLYGPDLVYKYGLRSLKAGTIAVGVGGYEVEDCGYVEKISVGPIVYQRPPACLSHSFNGRQILAGLDFMQHFNMIFDYPESKIVFLRRKE